MNKRIYVIALIISVLLMAAIYFTDGKIGVVLSSIGCSGFSAATMALIIEHKEEKRKEKYYSDNRRILFSRLNDQLVMLVERFLWFDKHIEDEGFDWTLDVHSYNTKDYMIGAHVQYKDEIVISYNEAKEMVSRKKEEYSTKCFEQFNEKDKCIRIKLFAILSDSFEYVIKEIADINNNKIMINIESGVSLSTIESLLFKVSLAYGVMVGKKKDFRLALEMVMEALDDTREIGGFQNDIRIGVHGSFPVTDI